MDRVMEAHCSVAKRLVLRTSLKVNGKADSTLITKVEAVLCGSYSWAGGLHTRVTLILCRPRKRRCNTNHSLQGINLVR